MKKGWFKTSAKIQMLVYVVPLDLSVDLPHGGWRQGDAPEYSFFVICHAVFIHFIIQYFV